MAHAHSPRSPQDRTRTGSTNEIFRRSTSIFSRRGDDMNTRGGQPDPLSAAARMPPIRLDPPKISRDSSSRQQRGTLLNLVPITGDSLSNGASDPALPQLATNSAATRCTAPPPSTPLRERQIRLMRSASRLPRTKSQQAKSNNARIGVWVDGVALWDEVSAAHLSIISEETASASSRSSFNGALVRHRDFSHTAHSSLVDAPVLTLPHLDDSQDFAASLEPLSSMLRSDESAGVGGDVSSASSSSTTSSDSGHDDVSSLHNRTGSNTSVDTVGALPTRPANKNQKTRHATSVRPLNVNKGLPPTPVFRDAEMELPVRPRRAAPPPPRHHIVTQALENTATIPCEALGSSLPKIEGLRIRGQKLDRTRQSPTLRSVEKDVDTMLSEAKSNLSRKSSVQSVLHPRRRTPTLPRRSRKREWKAGTQAQRMSLRPSAVPERRHSTATGKKDEDRSSSPEVPSSADVRRSRSIGNDLMSASSEYSDGPSSSCDHPPTPPQILVNDEDVLEQGELLDANPEVDAYLNLPSSDEAVQSETVLVSILSSLHSLRDLVSMAMINKGMYRVYQENELELITRVLRNESPPAAEFRDWRCPGPKDIEESTDASSSFMDLTPEAFRYSYARDLATLNSLKVLMASTCESITRRHTFLALSSPSHFGAQRVDKALWRIWCFCEIFGSDKDREDDLVGQLDWLKGGQLAKSGECEATVNQDTDFEVDSVMLNPPEFFANGNGSGLTASELFDMLELWTCMSTLLHGYHGRIKEARAHGIFDSVGIAMDDVDSQRTMLEEWTSYIMTLGPDVVLELASVAYDSAEGFARAQANGWTQWSRPQYSSSRDSFLKDPVTRLYREQIQITRLSADGSTSSRSSSSSRTGSVTQRTSHLAIEIRLARQESQQSQHMLRIPSASRDATAHLSRSSSVGTAFSFVTNASRQHYRQDTISDESPSASSPAPSAAAPPMPPPVATTTPTAPPRVRPQPPRIDTTCSNAVRPNCYSRVVLEHYGHGEAHDTSNRAIRRLVDMGFLPSEAREALRVTDPGTGLRLDRAVEYLLRMRAGQ